MDTTNSDVETCPNDKGLDTSSYEADFTKGESALDKWKSQSKSINFGDQGMELTINKQGDHPTVATEFYIFFGKVEVEMKAAPGTGIVSTIVLESDVLDEIDWVCFSCLPVGTIKKKKCDAHKTPF